MSTTRSKMAEPGQSAKIPPSKALLPDGFRDRLGAEAAQHDHTVATMLQLLALNGYERVKPPLVEYEEAFDLIGERSAPMFRLMDPETQRVMAVRADMTPQVARIAMTRYADAPRPVRLSYAGDVVRFKGSALRPSRQYGQLGGELIGASEIEADAEVIVTAIAMLREAGVEGLTVDLTLPPLPDILIDTAEQSNREQLRDALAARDADRLGQICETGMLLAKLLSTSGPAVTALAGLGALTLPGAAGALVSDLQKLAALLVKKLGDADVTIDVTETTGFEYKTGVGFAFFAKGAASELGRGGRYLVHHFNGTDEPAVGFSLYMDRVVGALPKPKGLQRVLVLPGVDEAAFTTDLAGKALVRLFDVAGDTDGSMDLAMARGCDYILSNDGLTPVSQ